MKQNCWEVRECGRELGGKHTYELGVCPAAKSNKHNGTNNGTFAGRYCWRINGTMCCGKIQAVSSKKHQCTHCSFLQKVKHEEGSHFKL